MAHQPTPHGKLLGLTIQGDIGPLTYYTSSRNKIVAFAKSPPLSPPTVTQQYFRDLFRLAGRTWQPLTREQKTWWADTARKAGLRATGFNLWLWYCRTQNRDQLQAFARTAGQAWPPPG